MRFDLTPADVDAGVMWISTLPFCLLLGGIFAACLVILVLCLRP